LSSVLPVVRRWWWLLVIGAGVAAVMGFLVASRLPDTYEAEARLLVGPLSADRDTLQAAGAQARTYAALATTTPILDAAARRAGLGGSAAIRSKIHDVTASDVTRFISIRVRDGDAGRAASIANALAAVLVQKGATGPPEGKLERVQAASAPRNPVGPSVGLIAPLAALAGLLGAFGIAVLVDSLTTAVRTEGDLAAVAPVAVLGSVNAARTRRSDRPLVMEAEPHSAAAASYRMLATKIELSNGERPPRSLLVLDARGGRSSGRLAANLAAALAEDGTRVVVLDGDEQGGVMELFRRRGKTSAELAQPARPLRIGRMMFDRVRVRSPRLIVIRPRKPSEPVDPRQAAETIEHLLTGADLVVLTAPPVDRSANSIVWAHAAEATVLVAERDHTKREHMVPAIESLRIADANVIGTVLCGAGV
jgi:polysaccharide biosynthesis transport protein